MKKYILYNNDKPVAHFMEEYSLIKAYHADMPSLLPMQICDTTADGFASWLRERSIDLNTLQHRYMVNELWGSRDKISLALATHMFSISDTFTCFEEGEFISRSEICKPSDQGVISRYILISSDTSLRNRRIATPNVSTDGSFPKSWQYENGAWWLYKIQSETAVKVEVEISRVLKSCGWDTADYAYVDNALTQVKTRSFVEQDTFFEPYDSFRYRFRNASDDDNAIYDNIASLGAAYEQAWRRILLTDAFFLNTDRHMRNFGMIRSSTTGDVIRLAPNFDNNQAYLANPSGRYSTTMLQRYLTGADAKTLADLKLLLEKTLANPYLHDVATAVSAVI